MSSHSRDFPACDLLKIPRLLLLEWRQSSGSNTDCPTRRQTWPGLVGLGDCGRGIRNEAGQRDSRGAGGKHHRDHQRQHQPQLVVPE